MWMGGWETGRIRNMFPLGNTEWNSLFFSSPTFSIKALTIGKKEKQDKVILDFYSISSLRKKKTHYVHLAPEHVSTIKHLRRTE